MALSEIDITKCIVERFSRDFLEYSSLDVAIAGGGPSGMTAAYYLAKEGAKVAIFERNLHIGGGMWGGGMLFPKIVVQDDAVEIMEGFDIRLEPFGDGYYSADSVEVVVKTTAAAIAAQARIWVGISVEDVLIREDDRVSGVVVNWGAVELSGLHVDPLGVESTIVIDSTGHDAYVARNLARKVPGCRLLTDTGDVVGEKPMWAEAGEEEIVGNTREVWPGLVLAGMAANTVMGSPRMGAIFGGMFLSGKRAAEIALDRIHR
ncbi:MAG: sulfide-dependent adenosine diphosphate thiazole synthase [Actinomycetota bacterium]|nr:sulfide-dependent adenosine diphosphate thiazole synthase [Actinomycetota bacterium]